MSKIATSVQQSPAKNHKNKYIKFIQSLHEQLLQASHKTLFGRVVTLHYQRSATTPTNRDLQVKYTIVSGDLDRIKTISKYSTFFSLIINDVKINLQVCVHHLACVEQISRELGVKEIE